jgi:hypothetical protein
VEEAVEVVRNHEGGTGRDGVAAIARREVVSAIFQEWTPAGHLGEGAYTKDESHERKVISGSPAPCRER